MTSSGATGVFEGFEPALKGLVKSRFSEPTEIQRQVIPHVLAGRNLLVISETGSGKTESVLLPIFDLWLRERMRAEAAADAAHVAGRDQTATAGRPGNGTPAFARNALKPISMLYLTPLKSLNRDLLGRVEWWAEKLGFEVAVRHGDTSQYERTTQAANPADLLISTPETLQSVLVGKVMRTHLANVRWVVVDEVHELVDSKRGVQLTVGLERLKELIKAAGGAEPQIIGLSATVGSPALVAEWLRGSSATVTVVNASSAKRIAVHVSSPEPTAKDRELAKELVMGPETTARLRMIAEHIRSREAVLVFTNTRESAEALSSRLRVLDRTLPIETHHSSLAKDVRISAEQRFKSSELKALLCTSSLELGIDIGAVDFMVQYMSPRQVLKLLQRLGRAGHSLKKVSEGTIIASDIDDCFESAVIGRLALRKWVEETHCYEQALDVLGQQIIGIALEEYKVPLEKAYGIVKRAYPYRNLSKEQFVSVVRLLEKLRLLWVNQPGAGFEIVGGGEEEAPLFADDGDVTLKRSKRAWEYYYGNLSTIPDSKTYQIFDTFAQKPVGSLDAEFVAMHGSQGTAFIVKGMPWRILEVTQDRVLVEPMSGLEAAIPAWEGELIPVSQEVAQGVGRLRREVATVLEKGERGAAELAKEGSHWKALEGKAKKDELAAAFVQQNYPVEKRVAEKIVKKVAEQAEWGFVPTEHELLLEHEGNVVVIHSCLGSLANDTLGRVLAAKLSGSLGSVGLQTDPYRIILTLPVARWGDVATTLRELDQRTLESVLEVILPSTELFRWRFLHCAQRLGILSKDADFSQAYIKKIIEVYANTPAHAEALNEVLQDKLDIAATGAALERLQQGELRLLERPGMSPIARLGLTKKYELVAPPKPEKEVFAAFTERLLDTKRVLVCTQCAKSAAPAEVRELKEQLSCKWCGSKLLAPVPQRWVPEAERLLKAAQAARDSSFLGAASLGHIARKEGAEEQKWVNWMMDSGSLVAGRGKDAVIALCGRGVGPRTAGRILAKNTAGDDLLRAILEAERKYTQTKKFWKG